jgi:hypothetical protein
MPEMQQQRIGDDPEPVPAKKTVRRKTKRGPTAMAIEYLCRLSLDDMEEVAGTLATSKPRQAKAFAEMLAEALTKTERE